MTPSLVLTPLGGLGEIGMNCLVLEQRDDAGCERIAIDCGATFPSGDDGVDLLHPRFDALLDEPAALRALFLTHGHEDHIGAIPYLVRERMAAGAPPLPIVGPAYAIELTRERLEEVGVEASATVLQAIRPGESVRVGGFTIEPIRVAHSIVDATALLVHTNAGTILHTGDFKFETDPLDGQPTDEARLARAGDEGVRLLLSDSTNVFQEGHAGRELPVVDALDRIVGEWTGRIVIGLFASNVHRLGALGALAKRHGRHVCLLGRSVRRHAELARRLGWIDWPSDLVVAPEIAATLPHRRVLYLATGTQAEPRGALARLASGEHPDLRLGRGDRVVLSSRVIPGSERAVFELQDALLHLGVDLVTRLTHPAIHVSGHAHRAEQQRMIELVRPKAFIPLHGTLHHLQRHEALARSLGVEDTMVLVDGERAELGPEGLARRSSVVSGRVAIAGGQAVEPGVLRQRREMGRAGLVVVLLALDGRSTPASVQVVVHGVLDADATTAAAVGAARSLLATGATRNRARLADAVRRAVRSRIFEATRQRPVVDVRLVPDAS